MISKEAVKKAKAKNKKVTEIFDEGYFMYCEHICPHCSSKVKILPRKFFCVKVTCVCKTCGLERKCYDYDNLGWF